MTPPVWMTVELEKLRATVTEMTGAIERLIAVADRSDLPPGFRHFDPERDAAIAEGRNAIAKARGEQS